VGAVSYESGNAGNYASPLEGAFHEGRNRIRVERGGGGLAPGDNAPTSLAAIVLEPVGTQATVQSAQRAGWRELCARTVDWIELVRPA
jgi:hypothetical protein